MAIQDIPGGFYFPDLFLPAAPSLVQKVSLSGANGDTAFIFHVPRTGNIESVVWRTLTVTTPATIDVRLETVDPATGDPTGTLIATNVNVSATVSTSNTVFTATFTAVGPVTAGQLIALVFTNPAASFGSMGFAGWSFTSNVSTIPYHDSNSGGAWTKSFAHIGCIALIYDDGTYIVPKSMYVPPTALNTNTFNNGSTPDVRGLRFQLPISVRVAGAWVSIDFDGDVKIMLVSTAYNQGAGTGILGTVTLDANQRPGTTGGTIPVIFDTPVTLSANTNYRLVVEPQSGTSVTVYDFTVGTSALMGAFPGGADFHLTTAKDPTADGDWTNFNSGTFAHPFMGLLIDGIDDAGGGGGGATGGSYAFTG